MIMFTTKKTRFYSHVSDIQIKGDQICIVCGEALNGDSKGKPTMGYNLQFMFHYQINWMYFRYFMWGFVDDRPLSKVTILYLQRSLDVGHYTIRRSQIVQNG